MNYSIFRSRTFYTILAMVIVGAGNALVPIIPAAYQALAVTLLGILAANFHLSTAQNAGATN